MLKFYFMKFLTYFLYLYKGFGFFLSRVFNKSKTIAILIGLGLFVSSGFNSLKTSEYLTQALSFNFLFPQSAYAEPIELRADDNQNPEGVRDQAKELARIVSELEDKIKTLEQDIQKAEGDRDLLVAAREEIENLKREIEQLETEAQENGVDIGGLKKDLDRTRQSLADAEKKIKTLEQELAIATKNNLCVVNENAKPQMCFFALNGPDESKAISNDTPESISSEDGLCFHCLDEAGKRISCKTSSKEITIKEFYACKGGSVSKAFEKMTKQRCDGLVISGHHVGYYTGKQTQQTGTRDKGRETLELDFLENLSCLREEGASNCQEWFSKINYLHLHGSNTAGLKIEPKNYDKAIQNKMKKYPSKDKDKQNPWKTGEVRHINREFASTLDESNPLTSRYGRMFPQALIFGWSGQAKTIEQGSPQEILNHMKVVGKIARDKGVSNHKDNLVAFLDWLPGDKKEDVCTEKNWIENRGEGLLNNKLFSYEDDKNLSKERELGCDLSNALRQENIKKIEEALKKIIKNCEGQEQSCRHRLLNQNISRMISLFNKGSNLNEEDQKSIAGLVLNLFKDYDTKSVSIVRDADHIVLYTKLLKLIKPNADQKDKLAEYELALIKRINSIYNSLGKDDTDQVYKEMLAELIWNNNIGQTLDIKASDSPANIFIKNLEPDDDKIGYQSILVRVGIERVKDQALEVR